MNATDGAATDTGKPGEGGSMPMIRRARGADAETLTRISFDSKRYWGYPEAYFERWAAELTIDADYVRRNDVFVFEARGAIRGYYATVECPEDIAVSGIPLPKGFWLEHMFVSARYIGRGIGSQLFDHLRAHCRDRRIDALGILADPKARGFYERMGCVYVGEYPSTIKDRTTPHLRLIISPKESP